MRKEYHKIETLFKFDQATKKHVFGDYYNEDVRYLKDNDWIFTEKIDGTNFRIIWDGHKLTYGGRTDNAQFSDYQKSFIRLHLVNEVQETLFEQMFQDKFVTVYGELYGNSIQKGGLYVDGKNVLGFKAFDVEVNNVWLTFYNAQEVCNLLGYDFVPIALIGTIDQALDYVKENETSTFSKAVLEGLVGKPTADLFSRLGKRIVVKIKRRDLFGGGNND
jgi:hypothetical protein